jgi:hypothetical protein
MSSEAVQAILSFDGPALEKQDTQRLGKQSKAVLDLMRDSQWRTLREIANNIGVHSDASVSARLRDFRKKRFGAYTVNRRKTEIEGLFEYQVVG